MARGLLKPAPMPERPAFNPPLPLILALLALLSLFVSVPAFPATYVVDPTGSDAAQGDHGAPWRTIQHAASNAAAGDLVIIRPGTYVESVYVARGGVEGAPLVFAAEPGAVLVSPSPGASLEAFNIAAGTGWVTLTGIEATGGFGETIFLRDGSHNIRIEGCKLHRNRAGIILSDAHDIVIAGCSIHDNSSLGIRFAGNTRDVLVSDTESFANDDGLGCGGTADGFAATPGASNITFVRTRAHRNGGDGFDLLGGPVLLDTVESSANGCTGFKLWHNASVRNCLAVRNRRGFAVTSLPGGTAVEIAHCTVANNDGVGIDMNAAYVPRAYAVDLRNSIVAGSYKALQFHSSVQLSEAYNILFRSTLSGPVLAPTKGRGVTARDINTGRWSSRWRQGQGTLAVDPLFVDPENDDFSVQPTSAAVGRGPDLGIAATMPGAASNLGIYQRPTGATNHSPWAHPGADRLTRVKRRLRFNAVGSVDPDGDPLSYLWNFGDGSEAVAGFRATHVFTRAGVYPVTLTVSDGRLSGSTTIHATVID